MLISTSFLSSKNPPIDLKKLNETDTDFIHVDVMDGKFTSHKTMPFSEMQYIYKFTSKRLDVHLMVKDPSKYIPLYASLNTEYLTFPAEIGENITENLNLIKKYSLKCGLAISPNTKVNTLIPYLPLLDIILVMSVEPGQGGQEFIPEIADKIIEIKKLINEYHLKILINVDGGINNITKKYCHDADILTSGSYVISAPDFQEKITSLR